MIYSIEKANLISEQLRKFKDCFAHQLAGHTANISFWIKEVKEALVVLDEYNKRFYAMRDEQVVWIENHGEAIHDYCPTCGGKCEFSNGIPSLPIRVESSLLKETRKNLVNAAYYFLIRGYNSKLMDLKTLEHFCAEVGTSIDPKDLNE
ncbi:hypothetical protein [Flavobacterium phycosphaerae]|uniref:hypothetical protein n=1 Tax=Flavobacterium phycosphaerae TaxID=2697515 RepID=UPI001389C0AE|nr:hypothetical protein [Flavobacterium phycosphaerae]